MNTNTQVTAISSHLPIDTTQRTALFSNTIPRNTNYEKHKLDAFISDLCKSKLKLVLITVVKYISSPITLAATCVNCILFRFQPKGWRGGERKGRGGGRGRGR